MNILDIILALISSITIIGAIALTVWVFVEFADYEGIGFSLFLSMGIWFLEICILLLTFVLPFVVLDKSSGVTIGTVTSVDKDFWGNTKIYVKTDENHQEEYCTEDDGMAELATRVLGKTVKISYGTRVGIYSTGRCHSAPVRAIEFPDKEVG